MADEPQERAPGGHYPPPTRPECIEVERVFDDCTLSVCESQTFWTCPPKDCEVDLKHSKCVIIDVEDDNSGYSDITISIDLVIDIKCEGKRKTRKEHICTVVKTRLCAPPESHLACRLVSGSCSCMTLPNECQCAMREGEEDAPAPAQGEGSSVKGDRCGQGPCVAVKCRAHMCVEVKSSAKMQILVASYGPCPTRHCESTLLPPCPPCAPDGYGTSGEEAEPEESESEAPSTGGEEGESAGQPVSEVRPDADSSKQVHPFRSEQRTTLPRPVVKPPNN